MIIITIVASAYDWPGKAVFIDKHYVETMWKSKLPTLRNQGFWKDMQTQHIISMQT